MGGESYITYSFEAGILMCGKIREFLKWCKFRGYEIEWLEGKGWFVRDWTIKGPRAAVQDIRAALEACARE